MSRPRIAAVLVPNGLGHARRTLGVLARYLERGGDATVTVIGEEWQRSAASGWPSGRRLERHGARWCPGVVEPGVHWTLRPHAYDDGRLLAWEDRLAGVDELASADVVLSDNLVGVLSHRPDALLLGSFLWSDVFADSAPAVAEHPAVLEFVAHERRLLAEHRPEMVCVEALATPGVLARTRARPVGWMCPEPDDPFDDPSVAADSVAVLGGWTGSADDVLVHVVAGLEAAGLTVTAAAPIAGRAGVAVFDQGAVGWRSTGAVVCRPGAGTLTDCVQWGVPVVCVREPGNSELEHNASQVERLGLGVDAGEAPEPAIVVAAVQAALEPDRRLAVRRAMASTDRHGLDQAAEWLAARCGVALAPVAGGRGLTPAAGGIDLGG